MIMLHTSVSHHSETAYAAILTDNAIAKLLAITLEEYQMLLHRPLEAFVDDNGNVIAFYIRFSTNNNERLLEKLNIDKNYIVTFKPEQVYKFV
jgi:hypothetical protein